MFANEPRRTVWPGGDPGEDLDIGSVHLPETPRPNSVRSASLERFPHILGQTALTCSHTSRPAIPPDHHSLIVSLVVGRGGMNSAFYGLGGVDKFRNATVAL